MKSRTAIHLIIFFAGIVWFTGCDETIRLKTPRMEPVHAFESYRFDPDAPLASRVAEPPSFLLSYLKKMDNSPDYEPYLPGKGEMESIRVALDDLPPLHKKIMRERLIGIYFVRNFKGSGLTDWVVDQKNTAYSIMVFNASVLSKSISSLVTERERTCFIDDDPSFSLSIDCGARYGGFMYILLHESTHLVDYIKNITPYTETQYKKYLRIKTTKTDFTGAVWKDYNVPNKKFMFSNKVAFYGFNRPQLRVSDAERVYSELSKSPFISLYGSQSWAEDLAELESFYHLTRILKQPLIITITRNGKKLMSMYPGNAPEVKKRLPLLKIFYDE